MARPAEDREGPMKERIRPLPTGAALLVGFGAATVVAGLRLRWLVPIREPRGSLVFYPGMEPWIAGPSASLPFAAVLFATGTFAVHRAAHRKRFWRATLALAVGLVVAFPVWAYRSTTLADEAWFFLLDVALLYVLVVGLVGAVAGVESGRRRLSRVALGLTGAFVVATSLGYALEIFGVAGTRPTLFYLGAGAYVTVCGGILLLIGSAFPAPRAAHGPEELRGPDNRPIRESVPIPLVLLGGCAASGVLAGTWLDWLVPVTTRASSGNEREIVVGGTGAVVSTLVVLVVGLTVAGLTAAVALLRSRRDRASGLVVSATGLAVFAVPLARFRTTVDYYEAPYYLVAPGTYVTAFAGLLLVVAGALLTDWYRIGAGGSGRDPHDETGRSLLDGVPWGASALATTGIAFAIAGTWFDWLAPIPGIDSSVPGAAASMTIGIAGTNVTLLALMIGGSLVALSIGVARNARVGGLLLLGTGVATVLQTGWRMVATAGVDGVVDDVYLVGPGPYLALIGGVVLLVAGAILYASEPVRCSRPNDATEARTRTPVETDRGTEFDAD